MVSFAKSALFTFLRSMQSINLGRNLKAFILRSLLLWPRILRSLRKVWSSYFQTSYREEKKTKGDTGGPFYLGTTRKREEYVVVCASQDFGGVGGPSRHSALSNAEQSIQLEDGIPRNPNSSVDSVNTPVRWTHSRATDRQFTGASSRSHSRPSSPFRRRRSTQTSPDFDISTPPTMTQDSQGSPEDSTSGVSIQPSPRDRSRPSSPFRRHFSRPSTPTSPDFDVSAPPIMTQGLQGSYPGYPASLVSIQVEQPSRSAPPATTESMYSTSRPRLPSIDGLTQSFPISHQHPSTASVNSSGVSWDLRGHSPSMSGGHMGAQDSKERIQDPLTSRHDVAGLSGAHQGKRNIPNYMTSQSIQTPHRPPLMISGPSVPRIPTQISMTDAQDSPPRPDTTSRVWPMQPDEVSRYLKKGDVPKEGSAYLLPPLEVDLPHSHRFHDSGDWIPVTHPGGALYFYHERMRVFTDVYMYDPKLREEVHKSVRVLKNRRTELESNGIHFPNNYDIVLDIIETEDKTTIRQYYIVNHDTRTLFWLEYRELLSGILGAKEPGHIRIFLESLYWVHWSLYPIGYRGRDFPTDASKELLGVLLSSSIDSLTSKVSTAPYSVADMQTMCDIINKIKDLGPENPHAIFSVALLLSICVRWRFLHFHGQKTSRLNRCKSIYADGGHKRTILFRVLSPILFFTPDVHLPELKGVWADEIIIEEVWKNFMQKLISEWIEFVLYSTVMLAANVGFLAIQGVIVVPSNGGWIKASPAQIASSMSLVFSIGSIISGLLLIRRNRTMATQDPRTACDYLDHATNLKPFFYLEPLATIFSLTYALLMWSVSAFFVALLLFSFRNATREILGSVGVASGIVVILIICCIANSWDSSIGDSES